MRFALAAVLSVFIISSLHAQSADTPKNADGAYIIFNGKDLTGWDGNPAIWSVQDGAITGLTTKENPTKGNTFCIWRGGKPKDFELRCMFRLENHNSGIQYRSKDKGNWVVNGYQADMDGDNTYTGILYEEGGRGIVAQVGNKVVVGADGNGKAVDKVGDAKQIKEAIKKKDWNEYVITCKGNHLVQKINGNVTVDVTDEDEKGRSMEGIIAFQIHAGPPMKVQFKDITLKVLE